MGKAAERFKTIFLKFENSDISISELSKLDIVRNIRKPRNRPLKWLLYVLIVIFFYVIFKNIEIFNNRKCLVQMPRDASKLFREPEYCDICETVDKVDKISNVSPSYFLEEYIKPVRPVVVTDGALNWRARSIFNFNFFKKLFTKIEINRSENTGCQFFPYKTEFQSLEEVFGMNEARAMLKPGEKPWYIGWNNCNDDAGKYLKQFYQKPYFLSNMTENIALSWIFMGGPGHGAHMHVDNVHYPSWQAQLSGRKLWRLAPPPECYYKCKELDVVVETGEIIVLDTNRWYHQTNVLPGELSITIGSEFD
ncbi:hypothetical protein GWI33_002836 [Rhynchophorus ferrugineus]|uniref:JmjC domain-containing protein n=1 Tax=Rhynchophorus ferrugineus TaxID=354439 RepID=A0A834MLG7_RHYFE|nr:hypothetical protein GWI33_002836 [Rhynchophorus ferrugineus]